MELTKEYLDQALSGLASKKDLDNAVASLATRVELASTEKRIIKRIDEAQEELARMTSAGFEDMQSRLDVAEQMKTFERKFQRLEEALHIKL